MQHCTERQTSGGIIMKLYLKDKRIEKAVIKESKGIAILDNQMVYSLLESISEMADRTDDNDLRHETI